MAVKDFEMRIKNTDGSYDILHPVTKMENVIGLEDKIILESGNNVHGSYIKFGDGTLICYIRDIAAPYDTAYTLEKRWTYPASFTGSPPAISVSFSSIISTLKKRDVIIVTRYKTTTSCLVTISGPETIFQSGDSILFDAIAIGRWK